jgi:hypothetical protein
MPRKVIKKLLPEHRTVLENRWLRPFRALLHDPALFVPHRRGVVRGFAIGMFWAFMPVPGQSVIAAGFAIWLRVNVLVAMAATWITNPFTAVPIVLSAHAIGSLILGPEPVPAAAPEALASVDPSALAAVSEWLARLLALGEAFLLGSLVMSAGSALVCYFALNWFWLWSVRSRFAARRRAASPPAGRPPA